jgi:hypothetical protein
MVVVNEADGVYFVADGKERPLERPKLKNPKHLCFTNTVLLEENFKTNKALRKSLAIYRDSAVERRNRNV